MVGLNHEFARELLWREYPTDQRGSYFRQFWDPSGQLSARRRDAGAATRAAARHPAAAQWSLGSTLGEHDHRELVPGTAEEEVVLVIRGELLKRYPTAVIYAQRAEWVRLDGMARSTRTPSGAGAAHAGGGGRPAAEQAADAAVRSEGRSRRLLLRLRPDGRGRARRDRRAARPTTRLVLRHRERPGEPRFGFDIERERRPERLERPRLAGRAARRRRRSFPSTARAPTRTPRPSPPRRPTSRSTSSGRTTRRCTGARTCSRRRSPTSPIRRRCWWPCTRAEMLRG